MLRPMRLLPRPTPTLSHGLMPSKFSEDCPCTLTSSLWTHFTRYLMKTNTLFFSGLRTYSRRNTSTFKGSPFKPIIVYVAAPEMSSAYLYTILHYPSAEVSCQQSAWIWDFWMWHHVRQAQDLFTIDIHCRDRGEACPGGDSNTWTRA